MPESGQHVSGDVGSVIQLTMLLISSSRRRELCRDGASPAFGGVPAVGRVAAFRSHLRQGRAATGNCQNGSDICKAARTTPVPITAHCLGMHSLQYRRRAPGSSTTPHPKHPPGCPAFRPAA